MTCQQARKLLQDGCLEEETRTLCGSDPALAKETVLAQPAPPKYPTPCQFPRPAHASAITHHIHWDAIVYKLNTSLLVVLTSAVLVSDCCLEHTKGTHAPSKRLVVRDLEPKRAVEQRHPLLLGLGSILAVFADALALSTPPVSPSVATTERTDVLVISLLEGLAIGNLRDIHAPRLELRLRHVQLVVVLRVGRRSVDDDLAVIRSPEGIPGEPPLLVLVVLDERLDPLAPEPRHLLQLPGGLQVLVDLFDIVARFGDVATDFLDTLREAVEEINGLENVVLVSQPVGIFMLGSRVAVLSWGCVVEAGGPCCSVGGLSPTFLSGRLLFAGSYDER